MKKLHRQLFKYKNARILDIGTGNGTFIGLLLNVKKDYKEIIGVDILPRQIELANNNFDDKKIKFMNVDIFNHNFKKNSFDIVCLSNTLHHLDDINKMIALMEELVTDKGILIFNEMYSNSLNKSQKSHLMIHHFAAEIDRSFGETHYETFKNKDIINKIKENTETKIIDAWDMVIPRKEKTTDEEIKWFNKTIDRLIDKAKDEDKEYYRKKALKIRKHIKKHGFESATQLLVLTSKFKTFTSIKEVLK